MQKSDVLIFIEQLSFLSSKMNLRAQNYFHAIDILHSISASMLFCIATNCARYSDTYCNTLVSTVIGMAWLFVITCVLVMFISVAVV